MGLLHLKTAWVALSGSSNCGGEKMGLFKKKEKVFTREDFERLTSVLPKPIISLNKGSLREAESYLKVDESPLHVEPVNLKKTPGILVVSDKRIFFVVKTMGQTNFKQLPYDTISNVSMSSLLGGTLEIHTLHEKLEITAIHHKRVKDVYKTIINHTT